VLIALCAGIWSAGGPQVYGESKSVAALGSVAAQASVPLTAGDDALKLPQVKVRPALDGFCPVTLMNNRRWQAGNLKYKVDYNGCQYLMADLQAKLDFLALPHRYAPVLGGCDPVEWVDHGKLVPGMRSHGVYCNDRVFLFVSEENLASFSNDAQRYRSRVDVSSLAAGQ
jgi:protein disulfide-isomerase